MSEACPKIGYISRRDARRSLKLVANTRHGAGGMRAYRCPRCSLWHLGHKRKGTGR